VDGVAVDDEIYLTNSVVGGDDGLYATVGALNTGSNTVTINSSFITSPLATFDTGSIFEIVPMVIYDSPNDNSGVTRDSGNGAVLLANNSEMELTYYSFDGTEITPPLTNNDVVTLLRSMKVKITVTTARNLSTGSPYVTSVEQRVGIRNLNYIF
jgi:hypothetical protein